MRKYAVILLILIFFAMPYQASSVEPKEGDKKSTVRQIINDAQALKRKQYSHSDNALNHIRLYFTSPNFRDQAYVDHMRLVGVLGQPQDIPYFRTWFDYMLEEFEESRELNQQHRLALSGEFTPDQIPQIIQWLEDIGSALDAMHSVAGLPILWYEIDTSQSLLREKRSLSLIAPLISDLIESYRIRSFYNLKIQENNKAVQDFIAADRLAKLMMKVDDHFMREDAYRQFTFNADLLTKLLSVENLSQDHLKEISDQWASKSDFPTSASILDQGERYWVIDYVERVNSGSEKEPSFLLEQYLSMGGPVTDKEREGWDWMIRHELFDSGRAIQRVNDRYDWLVKIIADPNDFSELITSLKQANQIMMTQMNRENFEFVQNTYAEQNVPGGTTSEVYTDRIVDFVLALLMHPNRVLDGPVDEHQRIAQQRMGNIAIALTQHRLSEGAYPDSLEKLVPRFLGHIYADPFTDSSKINYTIDNDGRGFRLYCIGLDQIDEQGDGDDVSLRFESVREVP